MSWLDKGFLRRLAKVNIHETGQFLVPADMPFCPPGDTGALNVTFTREAPNPKRNFFIPGQQPEVSVTFYGAMRDGSDKEVLVARVSSVQPPGGPDPGPPFAERVEHVGWDQIFAAIDEALPKIETT